MAEIKIKVSYNDAFVLVKKVDDIFKKNKDNLNIADEDYEAIEEALAKLKEGIESEIIK